MNLSESRDSVSNIIIYVPIQAGSSMLYQASFMGNTDEVRELLKNGAHVNEQNEVKMNLDIISTCSAVVNSAVSHSVNTVL